MQKVEMRRHVKKNEKVEEESRRQALKMNKLEEDSLQHVKPEVKSRREMTGKVNINGEIYIEIKNTQCRWGASINYQRCIAQ